jgi:UDP-glucose 4-epimerase
MSVLVTGGAGYIGSHMVWALVDAGEDAVVLDNLTTGVRALVPEKAHFVDGNAGDGALVKKLIRDRKVDAVIHFAGSIVVPESIEKPLEYYVNNTGVTRRLLEACVAEGVKHFIFSSTAAVYGETPSAMVAETTPTVPINPYGRSKLMTEWMLEDTARAHDFHYVALRYFNVAGADPAGRTGQSTPRATHLIKRACQVALGRVPALSIYGTDYATPDGTGVRDYIHVSDLVAAHALALDHLRRGGDTAIFNCGYGDGFSVRQVVDAVERVAGRKLATLEQPRRPGDPPMLIADATRIRQNLGWTPTHDDLDEIVRTAYAWESRLNDAG